jgi:G3E family GTPase
MALLKRSSKSDDPIERSKSDNPIAALERELSTHQQSRAVLNQRLAASEWQAAHDRHKGLMMISI